MNEEQKKIIDTIASKPEVDAVFLTGSIGQGKSTAHSDLDLIIILKKNDLKLQSVYTHVGGTFADVFFFDIDDLTKMESDTTISANTLTGSLVHWLKKAQIIKDESGTLTRLIANVTALESKLAIPSGEQHLAWQKVNYNLFANRRYFHSSDPVYHEALELRLLYSVSEIVPEYFTFREIPWRGEKNAFAHLKANDPEFYALFQKFIDAASLHERFSTYEAMVKRAFPSSEKLWTSSTTVVNLADADNTVRNKKAADDFWKKLTS